MKFKVVEKAEPKVDIPKRPKKMTRRTLIEDKIKIYLGIRRTPEQEKELQELYKQLDKSKRGKSSKVKGATYERTIAKKFKEVYDIDLVRTPQSGGFAKKSTKADDFRGDITTVDKDLELNLHIECKDHKTWSLKSWLQQAKEDCPRFRIPVVIFHQLREVTDGKVSQESDDYITLRLDDFFNLVDKEDIIRKKEK